MSTVTVSAEYQVVIPAEIREYTHIEPGQKLHMLIYQGRIQLLPILPMKKLRGLARGISSAVERDAQVP